MGNATAYDFKAQAEHALADDQLRRNLRAAMTTLMEKRRAIFNDHQQTEQLRARGAAIKRRCLATTARTARAPRTKCTQNGIQVHWADTTDRGQRHRARHPQRPRRHPPGQGQIDGLRGDAPQRFSRRPRHRIHGDRPGRVHHSARRRAPLAHHRAGHPQEQGRDRPQLFTKRFPTPLTPRMWKSSPPSPAQPYAESFSRPRSGLSGVNFAIAETGTLLLVENEGNGRMCTTVPPVHIAVMGLEKVVDKLDRRAAPAAAAHRLGHRPDGHHLRQHDHLAPQGRTKRTAPRRCT